MSAFTSDVNCSKVQGSELGQDYCIFSSPLHADGVRAERPYIKDQVVYLETPAHFLQTIPNRQLALVCGNCARFVGSVGLQMKFLQKEVSRADLTNDPKTDFDGLQPLSSLVPCSGKCGEFYCSEECRVKHWCSKGHSLLCTGHIKDEEAEEHPLFLFKMHAVSTNEIFLMIGEIFAEIISYCEEQKEKEGKSIDVASKEIMARYSSFVRKRWWDAVQAPKGQKPIKFKKTLQNLVTETWDLLESALSLKEKGYDQILTADFVARTIGMFEQNNVGVRLANPTLEYLNNIDENTDFENIKAEIQKVADNMGEEDCCPEDEFEDVEDGNEEEDAEEEEDEESDEEGDEEEEDETNLSPKEKMLKAVAREGDESLFPPLDGTAFYLLTCKINHSCDPNVIVTYTTTEKGLQARLLVLKDIAIGEEFVQSYIDQSQPLGARQASLVDYGFSCTCTKCTIENATKA